MASLAPGLFAKYGNGIAKSGAESSEFLQAMRSVGLSDDQACVLAAWLGGAPPEKFESWKVWNYTHRQTAKEFCDADLDVADLLQELRKHDFELATLVEAKATQKQYIESKNEQRNVDEDVEKLKDKASKALTFNVLGLEVTPKNLGLAALAIVGLVIGVKVARAMRVVVG